MPSELSQCNHSFRAWQWHHWPARVHIHGVALVEASETLVQTLQAPTCDSRAHGTKPRPSRNQHWRPFPQEMRSVGPSLVAWVRTIALMTLVDSVSMPSEKSRFNHALAGLRFHTLPPSFFRSGAPPLCGSRVHTPSSPNTCRTSLVARPLRHDSNLITNTHIPRLANGTTSLLAKETLSPPRHGFQSEVSRQISPDAVGRGPDTHPHISLWVSQSNRANIRLHAEAFKNPSKQLDVLD